MTRSEGDAPPAVHGIIVGHGDLPRALLDAAASIVGDAGDFAVVSNTDCSPIDLLARLLEAVDDKGSGGTIVFVDMFGSSCSTASARLRRERPGVAVMCGVNLPMLIRFLSYRRRLPFDELVKLMEETGQSAVRPIAG
jgi:mannose PTS system EIIA component